MSCVARLRSSIAATIAALAACTALLAIPSGASAAAPLQLGTADVGYVTAAGQRRQTLFNETVAAKAGVVRLNAFWFRIAPDKRVKDLGLPAFQSDPNNPLSQKNPNNRFYYFGPLDAAVRDARARGLEVIITVQRAPRFFEADDRPPEAREGTWDPDREAFGRFAEAVARRYSGTFDDPDDAAGTLPRVSLYQAWNEPNLSGYLTPQGQSGARSSIEIYRGLLNSAYAGIKRANPTNTVAAAGTAPLESSPGKRVGPETFWRKLLCLSTKLKPASCTQRATFDIFDHHPITLKDPREPGKGDSVRIADYPDLTRMLRAAERLGTVLPAGRTRPLWASEIYWETNPPDKVSGLPPAKAARYLEEGIHMLYQRNVRLILNFFMADSQVMVPGDPGETQGGLLFNDLRRKPSFTAFRFPFVSERKSRRKVSVWGRSPVGGKLRIEQKRRGGWTTLRALRVRPRAVFTSRLRLKGKATLRARVGKNLSLPYKQK